MIFWLILVSDKEAIKIGNGIECLNNNNNKLINPTNILNIMFPKFGIYLIFPHFQKELSKNNDILKYKTNSRHSRSWWYVVNNLTL